MERLASLEIEVVLTEIKAAAIDVVAEAADRLGLPVVFVDNVPVEVAPARLGDLDAVCLEVARTAERRFYEYGDRA
jgi:predicted GTPase